MSNVIDMQAAREKKAEKDHGERQVLDPEMVNRSLYAGRYYLMIEDDAVAIQAKVGPSKYKTVAHVTTANTYVEFFENEMKRFGLGESDLTILSSSDLDFPEEVTSNKQTIELCGLL